MYPVKRPHGGPLRGDRPALPAAKGGAADNGRRLTLRRSGSQAQLWLLLRYQAALGNPSDLSLLICKLEKT